MSKTPDQLLANLNTLTIRDTARLMSAVESDETLGQHVLAEYAAPYPNLIGITGPPGVGKSQLVDTLLNVIRKRFPQARLGVVAVDPSSPRSGGALLGDRIRMMRHAEDPIDSYPLYGYSGTPWWTCCGCSICSTHYADYGL